VVGRGHQFLVRWKGCGADKDKWLAGREVEGCEALEHWLALHPEDERKEGQDGGRFTEDDEEWRPEGSKTVRRERRQAANKRVRMERFRGRNGR
jgi:hypothetical protein